MIARRRAITLTTDSLPSGYTRTQYYECNGGVYFDLDEKMGENTVIEMDFELMDTANQALFGSRKNAFSEYFAFFVSNGYFYASYNGEYRRTALAADTQRHLVLYFSNGLTVDNIALLEFARAYSETALDLYLAGCNYNGTATDHARLRLYGFKLYQGSTLVRDMVPCVRSADGCTGLYDRVGGKLYLPAA